MLGVAYQLINGIPLYYYITIILLTIVNIVICKYSCNIITIGMIEKSKRDSHIMEDIPFILVIWFIAYFLNSNLIVIMNKL